MHSSDLDSHLIRGSLDRHDLAEPPNDISIGSPICAQLTHVLNTETDTQTTLRATSVSIGRI